MKRTADIVPLYRERIEELPAGVTQIIVYRERHKVVLRTLKDWREVVDYFLKQGGPQQTATSQR